MAKVDRRVQKTRQALQEALMALILERGYEAITVQEVIDRANVGRSTFYTHFYDLDDLLQSEFEALQAEFDDYVAHHAHDATLWDLSRVLFQHAGRYKLLYKVASGKESGRIIHASFHRYLSEQIHERLADEFSGLAHTRVTSEVLEHHLASTFMALLDFWLNKRTGYSADDMAQLYQDLVKPGLDQLQTK